MGPVEAHSAATNFNDLLGIYVLERDWTVKFVVAEQEAYSARVRASLEDVKAGRTKTFKTADDLLDALNEDS